MPLFGRFRREESASIRLTPTEARQGVTPHVTRYVLGRGLVLVILAFSAVYVLYS